jgi:DNA-binding GntR family transcriptional regulator
VLTGQPRNRLLFELALASDLKARFLLTLKAGQLQRWLDGEDPLAAGFGAPGRTASRPPAVLREAFARYVEAFGPAPQDYLFKSRKGGGPLTVSAASRLVGSWFSAAGLRGLSGFLSLRKTRETADAGPAGDSAPASRAASVSQPADTFMGPVRVTTLNEMVCRRLEEAIISGRLQPGTRLAADRLAGQMKVSTIPVREALARLEARGLITIVPQKGAIVIEQSVESIAELLEIRLILESAAADRVVHLVTDETLDLLDEANRDYRLARRRGSVGDLLAASKRFHDSLYRDKEMPNLIRMINQIWDMTSPYYHIMFNSREGALHSGADCHTKIIAGMRERNRRKVLYWLKQDLNRARDRVTEALRRLENQRGR